MRPATDYPKGHKVRGYMADASFMQGEKHAVEETAQAQSSARKMKEVERSTVAV